MSAYAIAQFLPPRARRTACELTYLPAPEIPHGYRELRRTKAGYCPLGAALKATDRSIEFRSPEAGDVAFELMRFGGADTWDYIHIAAADFIADWDSGHITDLYDALGVPRPDRGAE